MFNTDNLPNQFDDPRSQLAQGAKPWWDAFDSGKLPDKAALEQIPAYRATWEAYCEFAGISIAPDVDITQLTDAQLRACNWEQRMRFRRVAQANPHYCPVKQTEVTIGVGKALDAGWSGKKATSTALMREAANKEITEAYMSRTNQKSKLRAALAHHDNHPAVQYAKKQGNKIRVDADALSPGLSAIQDAASLFRKLSEHEKRLADMEARMRDLETFKANTEARHVIEDVGQDPAEIARVMRADGDSYGKIAKALGRSRSTIQRWVD